jgi:LysM repeat protein
MKKFLFIFFAIQFIAYYAPAQKNDLLVKSNDKGLYLEHKVTPNESFYSLGRRYYVQAKNIASFNKLDVNKGLLIDQKIKIPLTDSNFIQKGNTGTPVYYMVKGKADLTKVSSSNKNVSVSNLKLWNNLTEDNVKDGAKLIIGFLRSKGMPAITIAVRPEQEKSSAVADENSKITNPPVDERKIIDNTDKEQKKIEPERVEPVVTKQNVNPAASEQGYFKPHFEQQVKTNPVTKNETVTSGIFKTESGRIDAKYYLLIDSVQPGSIIKIINPVNNYAVYAKVLGKMNGIRQNEGFDIRISNAAASALQIVEQDKFIVKINY